MPKNIYKLVASIAICQGAGLIGSFFTISSINSWYNLLNQPSFRPPNWLFGPVWTTLYTLMGISVYWIWMKGTKKKTVRNAITLFLVHIVLNTSWSIVFFGLHNIGLALVNIVALLIMINVMMIKFYKIDRNASYILIPYILWVSFATALNYSIWMLNK